MLIIIPSDYRFKKLKQKQQIQDILDDKEQQEKTSNFGDILKSLNFNRGM